MRSKHNSPVKAARHLTVAKLSYQRYHLLGNVLPTFTSERKQ